jgi:hypothetical protein
MRQSILFLVLFFFCLQVPAEIFFEQGERLIYPANFEALEILDGSPEHVEQVLRNLQKWESYRPASSSDATRNPFQRQRYKFFDSDE